MKRWIWIPVVIILAGIAITIRAFSIGVTHRADVAATPDMVKRGAYLVQAADCISCHTAAGGQPSSSGGQRSRKPPGCDHVCCFAQHRGGPRTVASASG